MGRWLAITDQVVRVALKAADAGEAVRRAWTPIDAGPLLVLAIGKASTAMARAAEEQLAGRDFEGIITVVPRRASSGPPGLTGPSPARLGHRWRVLPCDHPLATERNLHAAAWIESRVLEFAERYAGRGQLLVLLSGGGSAHLTLPDAGVPLLAYIELQRQLMLAGASINEINAVRKHAERLKGGRLAAIAGRLHAAIRIVSDVVGDPLDVVASGPFSPDPTTFADAIRVIESRGLCGVCPPLDDLLARGARGLLPETPKPGDPSFSACETRVILNNADVVASVAESLERSGVSVRSTNAITGEAAIIARQLIHSLAETTESRRGSFAIACGGEPTVTVGDAGGRGGPSQELALAAALELDRRGMHHACVIAFSTDGIDGPSDNAGGIGHAEVGRQLRARGLDPDALLAAHDSAHALEAAQSVIVTGPTGTNVNHVIVAIAHA
jgi:glycerate-2-kinase